MWFLPNTSKSLYCLEKKHTCVAFTTHMVFPRISEEFPRISDAKQCANIAENPKNGLLQLADLSEHANTILLDEVSKSGFRMQIKIGSLNAIQTKTQDQIHQVFGSRFSAKTDFIHLRGQRGQELYTRAIIQSIRNTLN